MAYSHAETANLHCPECGRDFTATLWLLIHLTEQPELLPQIHAGTIHTVPCPHCQHNLELDAPLLLYQTEANPPLIFSPAQGTSQEQDQEHLAGLVGLLRQQVGDGWQETWLEQLQVVPRPLLSAVLRGDSEAIQRELMAQTQQALTALAEEDPDVMQKLAEAAQQIAQNNPRLALLQQFIAADTWTASYRFAQEHPELLDDETDALLMGLVEAAQSAGDTNAHALFNTHLILLRRSRAIGLRAAFAEKMNIEPEELDTAIQAENLPPALRELLAELAASGIPIRTPEDLQRALETRPDLQARLMALMNKDAIGAPQLQTEPQQTLAETLIAWIKQETLEAAEAFLQQHEVELLTDEAIVIMQQLEQANPTISTVADHYHRLLRAREVGVVAMYGEIRRQRMAAKLQELLTQQGPIGQAVYQFIQIAEDDTALAFLQSQASLLLTWDAGNLLRQLATLAPDETRWQERYQQWLATRTGGGTTNPEQLTTQTQTLLQEVQTGPRYEIGVAMFSAVGDKALAINVLNFGPVTLRWQKLQMLRPDLTEKAVGRLDELDELHRLLHGTGQSQNVAIVGKGRSGVVKGMPGVGKSTLAALYAQEYAIANLDDDVYPGGIFWLQLGPGYTTPESVLSPLSKLAALAYSDDQERLQLDLPVALPAATIEQIQNTLQSAIFSVEAVQKMLSGHGRMLVVVDDVWERQIIPTIRLALPTDVHLLVTTRDDRVALAIGQSLPLDVLSQPDALALIQQTLPAMPLPLAEQLIRVVGAHPMALQIALGDLNPDDPADEWAEGIALIAQRLAQGLGVDPRLLFDIEPVRRLSGLIALSYQALARFEPLQTCFRSLGSFCPEAHFTTPAVAALCDW